MKPSKQKLITALPDQSVLGRMVGPMTSDSAFLPRQSWSIEKCEHWFEQTMRAFSKSNSHNPFSEIAEAEYTIVPARQVAAGVNLDSGVIVLTDAYLDYLNLISHHAAVMQLVVQLSKKFQSSEKTQALDVLTKAETTVPELFTWLAYNHLSGKIRCGKLIARLSVGGVKEAIQARYANWVVYTLRHELGHLDIFHRGLTVENKKEEFYCDAFALKGWKDDIALLRFTRDVVLLFTYQWPIDMRLRIRRTHPASFDRARMIIDGMNINGAFDDLIGSMSEFWKDASVTTALPHDVRKDAVDSVSEQDVEQQSLDYVATMNEVFDLANFIGSGAS